MNNQIEKTKDILNYLPSMGEISKAYTPVNISLDMVNAIPADVFKPGARFLDLACKSGRFLKAIMYRLMESTYMQNGKVSGRDGKQYDLSSENHRKEYILREQLFGLALTKSTLNIARRNLYGTLDTDIENIIWTKEYPELVNKEKYVYSDTNIYKILRTLLGEKENDKMKFDVVIGNPPYNNGMDLDFVDLGYKLTKDDTGIVCMITPAKWQTTANDYRGCASKNINYRQFRERYTNRMSYVCFYPACKDVFDILQVDGITWYLIHKKEIEKCKVENKCKHTEAFNSIEVRNISNRQTLFNIGNEIIEYLGDYEKFKFPYYGRLKRFQVWTNTQVPGGGLSTQVAPRQTQFVGESYIDEDNGIYVEHSNASICSFSSDNEDECKSFISWLNCKFTRFFVAINISKLTGIITDDYFRFVPAPPSGKFDHIYSDTELYKEFNLPQKYIDIIESIVKERK